ncbi:hypothetical protein GPJ56_010460 [Histomonas meleagridis]|uniref:uncharacterized protein n=1 Tax=Histomonas meleagridis TaxID=135588 RepID=UPI0035599243|nr:hypothetical protein GPJ56_010460 [Histomonas meleagridis]KAH0798063.1 hypothetical protein GO595_009176 [Histomonas meleagridis]
MVIQNQDEIVSRSCLSIISILSKKGYVKAFFNKIKLDLNDWSERAKEIFLSFAFSFHQPVIREWEVFIPFAEKYSQSDDELLASTANDFLFYLKSQTQNETHSNPDKESNNVSNITKLKPSNGQEYLELEEGEPYNDEPPKFKQQLRNSIRNISSNSLLEEKPKKSTPKKVTREPLYSSTTSPPKRILSKPKLPTRPNTMLSPDEKHKRAKNFTDLPNISEALSNLKSKDWEKQNTSIEQLSKILITEPLQLSSYCKDIWLDLLDIITSPRTMLANNSLQFACDLYKEFSSMLCPQTSQFISTALSLTCNSHQFIADGATALLYTIAENSPRNRVIKTFVNGCKHRNSIARGKAIQCITITIDQGAMDEKEMNMLIRAIAPLLRDTLMETRDAAKKALKKMAVDERFLTLAKAFFGNVQNFNEMRKMIEV